MAWRLARSLDTLRSEVNGFAPTRSKASDGTLGDPAHAARASRHNPNRYGVVCAIDLAHDPAGGCDIHAIARRLVQDPHPELEYVISNAEVAKRRTGFRWEPYTGSNEHRKHAHFAVGTGPDDDPLPPYDSTLSWGVALTLEDDVVTDADILKIADAVTKAQQRQVDDLKAKLNSVQTNLAALQRRIHGIPQLDVSAEQHKADTATGKRFQTLLGD